jgi:Zn-finger nucleic acid-binding protein
MTERQGVEIDYCPQCRGVWLDRGELDKIIERASAELSPPYRTPAQQGERDYRDNRPYGRTKRRSILGDIFDF